MGDGRDNCRVADYARVRGKGVVRSVQPGTAGVLTIDLGGGRVYQSWASDLEFSEERDADGGAVIRASQDVRGLVLDLRG